MNNPVDQPKVSELIETLSDERLIAIRDNADNGMASRVMAGELLIARDRLAALPQPQATTVGVDDVRPKVAEVLAELAADNGLGCWRPCSGCYETSDGYNVNGYPFSKAFNCILGSGCHECGGIGAIWDTVDYDDMARSTLAPPALIGIPGAEKGEAETDEAITLAKDEGADFVLIALGKALGFENWTQHEGSETWDGDVHATLMHLLRDAGVLDPETDVPLYAAPTSERVQDDEKPRTTISLDLPHDYMKRDRLRVLGVSRDAENDKALILSLSRPAEDDELRRLHDYLRAALLHEGQG